VLLYPCLWFTILLSLAHRRQVRLCFSKGSKKTPDFSDFIFFNELARQLLSRNPQYRKNWGEFHVKLYHQQVALEEQAHNRSFIADRGTVDAFAFHPETMSSVGTTLEREYQRYSAVMQLGTAAVLGDRFYQRDTIRNEPASATIAIEQAITDVWRAHPRYFFVKAEIDFEKKYRTFLQIAKRLTSD